MLLTGVSTISKKYQKHTALTLEGFDRSIGAPILLGILFFFVVCLGAADSIKMTVMVVAVFALLVIAVRFNVLRERIHWPFIALTLVVLMDGISTFYAVSGKFALREFLKVFLAYLLAVILLATSPKNEEVTGKRIATILAVCTALGSLVSIDLISTRWISGAVTWILGHFTQSYEGLEGLQDNTRILSVFSNPNVFGGVSGLGILLSAGISDSLDRQKERSFFLVLLNINAVAFLLSNNRGALVFIIIASVVFILIKQRNNRFGAILILIETLMIAMVSTVIITKTSFDHNDGFQPIPLFCLIVGSAVLCGIDYAVAKKLALRLQGHGRSTMIATGALLLLAVVYAIAAINLTGEVTLGRQQRFIRVAFIEPGSYSLSVQTDGKPLNVTVQSQNQQEAMLKNVTVLFSGSVDDASFTVPEGSMIVQFVFQAPEEVRIISASYNGHRIPLRYYLLPAVISNRLHSTSVLNNLIQRFVYFQDGIKLFHRSPVIGLGIGAFENAIKSVQSYYYETKYAHNHYFQTLLETGTVGLLLFLGLLSVSFAAVLKSKKKHPYAPMLGAALIFMAGQSVTDIIFSAYGYLPIAYGTLVMMNYTCGEMTDKPKLTRTVRAVSIGVIVACTVIYCAFLAGNMMAKRQMDRHPSLQTIIRCVELDRFEWADYALPYVLNSEGDNVNPYVRQQADVYAERLEKVNSNTIPIYLAEYYFNSDRPEKGVAMLEKYVDYVSSDQSAWQRAFDLLRNYTDGSEVFRDGIARLAAKMETWNRENIGSIEVNADTSAFIEAYSTK